VSTITHLLFDCDGTLVDSERIAMAAMCDAGRALGLRYSDEDCRRSFLGHARQHALAVFERDYGRPLPPGFAIELARAIRHGLETRLQPIPGLAEALAHLPYQRHVVSNGSPDHVAFVLAMTGLAMYFKDRCHSVAQACPPKPSPQIYLQVMAALGVQPEQCLVIEDSVPGATAAVRAGIRTLGFADLASREELALAGCSATFTRMEELGHTIEQVAKRH
jgi:HAD superfamily hydrolase (TIGR01509 family)